IPREPALSEERRRGRDSRPSDAVIDRIVTRGKGNSPRNRGARSRDAERHEVEATAWLRNDVDVRIKVRLTRRSHRVLDSTECAERLRSANVVRTLRPAGRLGIRRG